MTDDFTARLYNAVVPPRFAYWTILIDNKATAFRSRDEAELLPTLNQLRRKNSDVVMKWFARGRLWDTPEQAQWAGKNLKGSEEKRGKGWRPGGEHKDPRARFEKGKKNHRQQRGDRPSGGAQVAGPAREKPTGAGRVLRSSDKTSFRPADDKRSFRPADDKRSFRPADDKKSFRPADDKKSFRPADKKHGPWKHDRPWRDKKPGGSQGERSWQPAGPAGGRPGRDNPPPGAAKSGRPWHDNPGPGAAQSARPGHGSPGSGASQSGSPWRDRPFPGRDNASPGAAKSGRPWRKNPAPGTAKSGRPEHDNPSSSDPALDTASRVRPGDNDPASAPGRPPGAGVSPAPGASNVHRPDAKVAPQPPNGEERQIAPKPKPADGIPEDRG
jgi:hypothetical protein